MAILDVPSSTQDGWIHATTGVADVVNTTSNDLITSVSSSSGQSEYRSYAFFAPPALPGGAIVTAVSLNLQINASLDDGFAFLEIYSCKNACIGTTLTLADYTGVQTAPGSVLLYSGNFPAVGLMTIPLVLNTSINTSQTCNIECISSASDITNSFAYFDSANKVGGVAPYVRWTYTPAAGANPPPLRTLLNYGT